MSIEQITNFDVLPERHDETGSAPTHAKTFVVQLDPATLLIQDDTDDAVSVTLKMMEASKRSFSRNGAASSGQVMNHQSPFPSPDANSDIELAEVHSTTGEERPDATRIATGRRSEELTTTGCATIAAATGVEHTPTASHADVERGSPTIRKARKFNKLRTLLIMFSLQAGFRVFLAVTLAGVGASFLYLIPTLVLLTGIVNAVISFIVDFRSQVKEGQVSQGA